jgi:hypothetical protein
MPFPCFLNPSFGCNAARSSAALLPGASGVWWLVTGGWWVVAWWPLATRSVVGRGHWPLAGQISAVQTRTPPQPNI